MKNQKVTSCRVAAIDLGSNSFQCLIAQLDQSVTVLVEHREPVRLRAGIDANKDVSRITSERAFEVLNFFRSELEAYQVQEVNVVGTQAFRELSANSMFLKKAEHILGQRIRVIDGLEEGFAIYTAILKSVLCGSGQDNEHHLVIDIGGGSTECVVGSGAVPLKGTSLPVGSVALKTLYASSVEVKPDVEALKSYCWEVCEPLVNLFKDRQWSSSYVAAGVAEILTELASFKGQECITFEFIDDLITKISSGEEVANWPLPSLTQDRRYIIVESLVILWAVMKRLGLTEVTAASKALRHALLLELAQQGAVQTAMNF